MDTCLTAQKSIKLLCNFHTTLLTSHQTICKSFTEFACNYCSACVRLARKSLQLSRDSNPNSTNSVSLSTYVPLEYGWRFQGTNASISIKLGSMHVLPLHVRHSPNMDNSIDLVNLCVNKSQADGLHNNFLCLVLGEAQGVTELLESNIFPPIYDRCHREEAKLFQALFVVKPWNAHAQKASEERVKEKQVTWYTHCKIMRVRVDSQRIYTTALCR